MPKDEFMLDIVQHGVLIKFGNDDYGFWRGDDIEYKDSDTLIHGGRELDATFIRVMNAEQRELKHEHPKMAKAISSAIGKAIREFRKEAGYTQSELPVSQQSVSRIENGLARCGYDNIVKIANELDVDLPDMLAYINGKFWEEMEDD